MSIVTSNITGVFGGVSLLDEDDMVSDSDSKGATQQSIKAYVDANGGTDISGLVDNAVVRANGTTNVQTSDLSIDDNGNLISSGGISILVATTTALASDTNIRIGKGAAALGSNTIAIGSSAGATATDTIAIGESAAATDKDAIAIGENSSASYAYATALGAYATATQPSATAVGYDAGAGSDNSVAIGRDSNVGSASDGSISIGHDASTTAASATALGDGSSATAAGAIAIGYTAASTVANALFLPGSSAGTALPSISATALHYNSTTGQVGPDSSSHRFKTDIGTLETQTENIYLLEPHTYSRVSGGAREPGYIAEEAMELFPELVFVDNEDKPYSFNYTHLVVPIIAELKKLRAELDEYKLLLQ
jgi:hypothetical protein